MEASKITRTRENRVIKKETHKRNESYHEGSVGEETKKGKTGSERGR